MAIPKTKTPDSLAPESLCLSGGSFEGFYILGAVSSLDLSRLRVVAGASAGALVGFILALGLPSTAVLEAALAAGLEGLTDTSLARLIGTRGLDSGDRLFGRVFEILDSLSGSRASKVCFSDLSIDLRVLAHCVETGSPRVFSKAETPSVPVALAVRMSCTVPILFAPVSFENSTFVDGCLSEFFPLSLLGPSPASPCGVCITAPRHDPGTLCGYILSLLYSLVRIPRGLPWALYAPLDTVSSLCEGGVTNERASALFREGAEAMAAFMCLRFKKLS